jgi:putative membrane protein
MMPNKAPGQDLEAMSFELSSRRTGLSIQRTRMSADRTLMSVIRTSLSLIGFGFTIFQFVQYLRESATSGLPLHAARNFGVTLVVLGIVMLVLGIVSHVNFARQLRAEREHLAAQHLVHGELSFPISRTFVVAILLLLIGLAAVVGMILRTGPLG